MWADSLDLRQFDHLGFVEENVARTALAGAQRERLGFLAEQELDGLAGHFVGDIEGVHVDDLT